MQNWDDEFKEIMQRKMKTYREKRANNGANFMSNKERYPSAPITLTDFNFNESVHKYPLLIVDFWAAWCGPCRMVSPVIDQLSSELAGKAVFGKLNVDDNTNTSNVLGIQSIPTIVVFKNGQAVDRIIGAMTKSHMISKISPYI
ncbi:MAG TPA: thioredoxin [Candidatus Nitrosocosmicus sp.]|nr:thioredoxin [Candidatus Nitrosocosmicus sp.]